MRVNRKYNSNSTNSDTITMNMIDQEPLPLVAWNFLKPSKVHDDSKHREKHEHGVLLWIEANDPWLRLHRQRPVGVWDALPGQQRNDSQGDVQRHQHKAIDIEKIRTRQAIVAPGEMVPVF